MPFGETVLGLVVAALLGGIVGFQREYTQKPAGLRTHALVSVGSCAFAAYSALIPGDTRIAAGIITGIGFLGAGAIVRRGLSTHGLTTAASIWASSAIGMGVGLGGWKWWPVYIALTAITMALLVLTDDSLLRFVQRRTMVDVIIEADLARTTLTRVRHALAPLVRELCVRDEISLTRADPGDGARGTVGYTLTLGPRDDLLAVFESIYALDGIVGVEIADEPLAQSL